MLDPYQVPLIFGNSQLVLATRTVCDDLVFAGGLELFNISAFLLFCYFPRRSCRRSVSVHPREQSK